MAVSALSRVTMSATGEAIMAIAAFSRITVPRVALKEACWRAASHGLDGSTRSEFGIDAAETRSRDLEVRIISI